MDTMHAHGAAVEAREIFSLPGLLDQSAALAAAQRLYVQNRAGLRFFCENRRVVSVEEAEAIGEVFDEAGERTGQEAAAAG